MNTLVKFIGNDVFTDSMVIAEGTGNQHESVVSLIKTHRKSLGRFGNLEFTDFKSGKRGRPTRIFQLNEPVLRNAPPAYGTSVTSLAGDTLGEQEEPAYGN